MRDLRFAAGFARLDAFEARLCLPCNHFARVPAVQRYFCTVSRLGDGVAWYAMLVILPAVLGPPSFRPAAHMAGTALTGVVLYKILKSVLVRADRKNKPQVA